MPVPPNFLNPQIVTSDPPSLPPARPAQALMSNTHNNSSPVIKNEPIFMPSPSESDDSPTTEQPNILCKYCKKENVAVKGNKVLKTCKTCLRKKREYEEARGKTLRSERIKMYTERYSILCSTCHTRRAMRKDGKQLHTCQRCAKYKRSKYKPKKGVDSPTSPTQDTKE